MVLLTVVFIDDTTSEMEFTSKSQAIEWLADCEMPVQTVSIKTIPNSEVPC